MTTTAPTDVDAAPAVPAAPPPVSIAALQGKIPMGVPARITHDGEEELRFAAIPLPMYEAPRNTLAQRKNAISVTYSGRLMEAVDLYRSTILQDGFFDGILRTMAEGILQLPLSFSQGTPEMCSALLNADGTAGDWAKMHPLEECAQIFKDGLVGFPGLGQYLLTCWNCGWTDSERVQEELAEGTYQAGDQGTYEICKRCKEKRTDRPIEQRKVFRLEWRDCRWLDQIPTTFQWYYQGRNGRVPIIPGDGEWFMFFTTPKLESWRHGIWIWASLYALFARDAMYDAQNTSQVCAPTPVLNAKKPVPESTRAAAEQRIRQLGFDNRIVLNGEWEYNIVAAKAEYKDICTDIVTRCSDAFETGLTGNVMGRAARTAFTDAGIYKRTTAERRGAAAQLWMGQTRDQGLVHWGRDNYGTRNVPVGALDARSPEDKLKDAEALGKLGDGIKGLVAGLKEAGRRPTEAWVLETCQSFGVRTEAIPGIGPQILSWDAKDLAGFVMMGEARTDLGLPLLGDARDQMMVSSGLKPGGDSTPAGALPSGAAAAPAPAPGAPPAPNAPPAQPPAARLEADDDCDEDEDDCDDEEYARRAARADAMNTGGFTACRHNRTQGCPRCGVRGHWMPVAGGKWAVTWSAMGRAARARFGSAHPAAKIAAAEAELDAALAALDALGPEDRGRVRAKFNPDQPRDADGKFGSGAGSLSAATKKGTGRSKAAAQARKDSKDARIATWRAKIGHIGHDDAAAEHDKAEKQNREAAAKSRSPAHRDAHLAVAEAHAKLAAAHREAHAAQPASAEKPPAPPTPPTNQDLSQFDDLIETVPKQTPEAATAELATSEAKNASEKAEAGLISHTEAAVEHLQAGGAQIKAKNAAVTDEEKAKHQAALMEHKKAYDYHTAKSSGPSPSPPSAPTAASPVVKTQPLNVSPAALSGDVKAKIAALAKAPLGGSSMEVLNGTKVAQEHIAKVLPSLSTDEKYASQKFSNGHDYEMRALERGVSKDDLVKSRMAKEGGTEKEARAHVEASAKMLPEFHAALDKLKTTTPPPPPLYRGMGVSERTLHELLTKDEYNTAGMSSSASLSEHTATGFADSNRGKKDYRGDLMTHAVVLVIHKATSSPIMHSELSHYAASEREQVLPRDGKYRVTKRERDTSGRIAIHLEEV